MLFTIIGWLSGWVYGSAIDPDPSAHVAWYETPAGSAALVSSGILIVLKLIDIFNNSREEKKKISAKKDFDDLTYSEKLEELTAQQWLDGIKHRDGVYKEQIGFLHNQLIEKDILKYEANEKFHVAMDELTKLQNGIQQLEKELIRAGVTSYQSVPMRSYFELMEGVSTKVENYAKSRRIQMEN